MGHRACYVIVEKRGATAYEDRWGAVGCTFVLADGPGECKNLARAAEKTSALLDAAEAEAGFLLDFDTRRCLAFGVPRFEDDADEVPAEVRLHLRAVTTALAEGPAALFEMIAPHWPGWTLVWDARGIDAFAEHLFERRITSIATPPPGDREGAPIEVVVPSAAVQAAIALADADRSGRDG